MSGNIGLIVLNLILFAMLVLAWQLWRQSVPKRRKVKAVEVADWPAGPIDAVEPQLVSAGAVAPSVSGVAGAPAVDASVAPVSFAAPVAPAPVDLDQPVVAAPVAPVASSVPAAPAGAIDDAELAALLNTAPPTSAAPSMLPSVASPAPQPPAPAPAPASALFSSPAPVSSLAPPAAVQSNGSMTNTDLSDSVSRQVGALLAAPRPAAEPVSSLAAPVASANDSSVSTTDRLRLDITGRPVDDVMRSLAARLGDMGYNAQTGPSGETVFQRGTTESIRIAVSAQEAAPIDADGRPLPARADIEVVGGQLQETTEAVLFELLDHGFQLRWAVAGELVLSSFDGALARVNVNPTESA